MDQIKYKKKYKCPYCDERFDRSKLSLHIDKKHSELIPEGFTASRVAFNTMNHKTVGHCIICGKETEWNEDKCRYERLCDSKKCHRDYVKLTEERLKASRGVTKSEMLSDPNFQNKMLNNRSISGTYKFSDGGSISYVGKYEKNFLEFMDKYLHVQSFDIQAPGPTIEYYYEGKKHFWITDFYYIPYNLVFDIKDGGNNPNKREMTEYRAKQSAKEKAITSSRIYNYIRLTDNQFDQLIEIMLDLKDEMIDMEGPYNQKLAQLKPIIRINEDYIRILNDYKDPKNCSWDEECTWHTILDALKDNKIDITKPMYVYDMNPDTYEIIYLGSITSKDGESYEWDKKAISESSVFDNADIDVNLMTSHKIVSMLSSAILDPKTYKRIGEDKLGIIKQYVQNACTDAHEIVDINTYLTTALLEHGERMIEYYKYLQSGKCVWMYQFDCECFKDAGITLEDMKYVGDYLEEIKTIAMENLSLGICKDLGYYKGTNDNIEEVRFPTGINKLYNQLKSGGALTESEIENLSDFDLEYFCEFVI